MFSFILCAGVLRQRGEIDEDVWRFFLLTQAGTATVAGATDALKIKFEAEDKTGIIIKLTVRYIAIHVK